MDDSSITAKPPSLSAGVSSPAEAVAGEAGLLREKKLRKACADFESVFIYEMLKTMRKTVPPSGLLNKMEGKDTYEMMTDQKVSEELAKKGGMGLQDVLFNQLKRAIK